MMRRRINTDSRAHKGFTLIEMLVVIVIILILSSVIFRLAGFLEDRTRRAKCIYELEQIQNALNEYFVEYGIYPPVGNLVLYEYECSTNQTVWFRNFLGNVPNHNDPTDPTWPGGFFPDQKSDTGGRKSGDLGYTDPGYNDGLFYRYGLVAHLALRARGGQAHWYDEDTARDKEAKARWAHFIQGIVPNDSSLTGHGARLDGLATLCPFSNTVATVKDPWGAEIHYECYAPFTRYKLWSSGSGDDIQLGSWTE